MRADPVLVEASLFFLETPRYVTDPAEVKKRARVLYGEARSRPEPLRRSLRTENLDGIRLLRIVDDVASFREMLTSPEQDHQGCRFSFGLVERPSILGLMPTSTQSARHDSLFTPSVVTGGTVTQFVQLRKRELAWELVEACGRQRVEAALDRISALTRQDLRHSASAAMFGDVYVVDDNAVRDRVVDWQPILDDKRRCYGIRVAIAADTVSSDALDINVRIYGADDAPLLDRLLRWERGMSNTFDISCNQAVGGAWLRAWRAGELIAEFAFPLLQSILGMINVSSGSIWLEDKLTSKTAKAVEGGQSNESIVRRVASVAHHSPMQIKIGPVGDAPWRQARLDAADDLFSVVRPTHEADTYFPKGAEGRVSAVDYLRKTISSSAHTLIVDPFFDEEAARALLPRIEHREAKLDILTWLDDATVSRFVAALCDLDRRSLLPTNLTIRRLAGAKQTFHDRNVVFLESGAKRPTVLSMTNSLSGWAKDFSLSIHRPTPYAAASRLNEIQQDWVSAEPHVLWPPHRPPKKPLLLDLFPRWEEFLEWFLPRAKRTEEEWLQAAATAGWLTLHVDRSISWNLHQLSDEQRDVVSVQLRSQFSAEAPLDAQMHSLMVWGEANCRAAPVTADDVAALVRERNDSDVKAFVERLRAELRRTFVADVDRTSMALTSMFAADASPGLTHDAFLACNDRFFPLQSWRRDYGREFAYAVLTALVAPAAIDLMLELNDPTMFVLLTSSMGFHRVANQKEVAEALLRSPSAFLRSLGAQLLVVDRDQMIGASDACAPADPMTAVRQLRELNVSAIELATYGTVWLACARSHGGTPPGLVEAFVATCESIADREALSMIEYLFARDRWVIPEVVKFARESRAARAVCTALLEAVRRRFEPAESNNVAVHVGSGDERQVQAITGAAMVLATASQTASSLLSYTFRLDDQMRLVRPVTPLRRRQFAGAALNAITWCLCCQLNVNGGPERDEAVSRARAFIDDYGKQLQAEELKLLLNQLSTADSATRANADPPEPND